MIKIWELPEFITEISNDYPGYDSVELKSGHVILIDQEGISVYKDYEALNAGEDPLCGMEIK